MSSDSNAGGEQPRGGGSAAGLRDDFGKVREEVRAKGTEAFESLKEGAASLGTDAKEKLSEYAAGQKEFVSENLDEFAQAIRRASDELSERDQTMASQLVRQAAGGLESLSRSISGSSFEDILGSVRGFGRSNPAAFMGGAMLVGFALGRFATASASRADNRNNEDETGSGSRYAGNDGRWLDDSRYGNGNSRGRAFSETQSGSEGGDRFQSQFRTGNAPGLNDRLPTGGQDTKVTASKSAAQSRPDSVSVGGSS